MQDENIKKMAEIALPPLTETPTINILICDLLSRLKREVTRKQLYDILVDTELVSYFFYQESYDYLKKSGSILTKILPEDDEGLSEEERTVLILTDRGRDCAKELKNLISKTYRDKASLNAILYFSMEKFKNQVKVEYEKNNDGYYVHVRCLDKNSDLLNLKFNVSNIEQAKFLGKKVMNNPSDFYAKVWGAFDTRFNENDRKIIEE